MNTRVESAKVLEVLLLDRLGEHPDLKFRREGSFVSPESLRVLGRIFEAYVSPRWILEEWLECFC